MLAKGKTGKGLTLRQGKGKERMLERKLCIIAHKCLQVWLDTNEGSSPIYRQWPSLWKILESYGHVQAQKFLAKCYSLQA